MNTKTGDAEKKTKTREVPHSNMFWIKLGAREKPVTQFAKLTLYPSVLKTHRHTGFHSSPIELVTFQIKPSCEVLSDVLCDARTMFLGPKYILVPNTPSWTSKVRCK